MRRPCRTGITRIAGITRVARGAGITGSTRIARRTGVAGVAGVARISGVPGATHGARVAWGTRGAGVTGVAGVAGVAGITSRPRRASRACAGTCAQSDRHQRCGDHVGNFHDDSFLFRPVVSRHGIDDFNTPLVLNLPERQRRLRTLPRITPGQFARRMLITMSR